MFTNLKGSYKLSEPILMKMISKSTTDVHGEKCESASSYEIMTILYFTHIADIYGKIENFKISDLQYIIKCNKRSAYNVMQSLEKKGFITLSDKQWSGEYQITLCNNDFSKVTDYRKHKYLNTNINFFNHYNTEAYNVFASLSLYAKRALLYLLFNYNGKYGYRCAVDTVREALGIKERSKILEYMKELEPLLFDGFYTIEKDKRKRLKYGHLTIKYRNCQMIPENGIQGSDDSFFKNHYKSFMKSTGIINEYHQNEVESKKLNEMLQEVFTVAYLYNENNQVAAETLDQYIKETITKSNSFTPYTVKDVLTVLRSTFGKLQGDKSA